MQKALIKLIKRPLVAISGHNSNTHSSNMTSCNTICVALSTFIHSLENPLFLPPSGVDSRDNVCTRRRQRILFCITPFSRWMSNSRRVARLPVELIAVETHQVVRLLSKGFLQFYKVCVTQCTPVLSSMFLSNNNWIYMLGDPERKRADGYTGQMSARIWGT